jgi:hypothetical protein
MNKRDRLIFAAWGGVVAFVTTVVVKRLNENANRAMFAEIETGWWRALAADGTLVCESSIKAEVLDAMKPGYTLQRLYEKTAVVRDWRPVSE